MSKIAGWSSSWCWTKKLKTNLLKLKTNGSQYAGRLSFEAQGFGQIKNRQLGYNAAGFTILQNWADYKNNIEKDPAGEGQEYLIQLL